MTSVLQAVDITKWRGQRAVLRGISLDVRQGEILTLLGPNGAGKSTLIAILAGVMRPETGLVQLWGEDLVHMRARGRARLGIALQQPGLAPHLTVQETLRFFSLCYYGNRPISDLLAHFRLADIQQRQIRFLSTGQRQRVAVALAFVKDFDVLLLDEPMAGLDPEGRGAVWQEIHAARARGAAVVCATHLMDEAQQHSDRILLLHAGQQLALASPRALLARLPGREKIELTATHTRWAESLAALPGVTAIVSHGQTNTLYCQSARQVLPALLAQDGLSHIACGEVSLVDVLHLFTRANNGRDA